MLSDTSQQMLIDLQKEEQPHNAFLMLYGRKESQYRKILESLQTGEAIDELRLTDERCLLLKYLASASQKYLNMVSRHWRYSQRLHSAFQSSK